MGPVTRALIFVNVVVFGLQQRYDEFLTTTFALWPIGRHFLPGLARPVGFEPWQLVTYSFLHSTANFAHILLNMLALWMFGRDVERTLGSQRYAVMYFAAVLSAGLVQLLVVSATPGPNVYPTIGASGGVFGILLAFALYFPHRIIMLIFPPIPMPAWLFVILYGLVELYLGVTHNQEGVAHFAHLGGMLGGFLTIQYWRGRWPFRRPGG
jgi:membrane associated rhomboid family serine protease